MSKIKLIFSQVIILSLFFQLNIYSQDTDIIVYLKQIEDGQKDQVEDKLATLKNKYPIALQFFSLKAY